MEVNDDDDHVRNYVGFQVTSKNDVFGIVTNSVATTAIINSKPDNVTACSESVLEYSEDFESDDSDGNEPNTKDI